MKKKKKYIYIYIDIYKTRNLGNNFFNSYLWIKELPMMRTCQLKIKRKHMV